jgi:GAF domain-containing protein
MGRTFQAGTVRNIADVANETEIGQIKRFGEIVGFKSILFVPLLREARSVGIFALARKRVGEFSKREIDLVQTFADQAVIAIENARLFDEVQAKTRDLSEALTYQTGSANILSVIASSPTDIQPVLNAIVKSACELCEAYDAVLVLKEGEELLVGGHYGRVPLNRKRWPNDRGTVSGRAIADRRSVHVSDVTAAAAEFPTAAEMSVRDGGRTVLGIPLMREGTSIGAIVLRRTDVDPFNEKQISLLQTFADQAVIAISNVNLFDQVQTKTRDLEESLQQQTATSEVLQVISSSQGELEPVFNKMLENATTICGAEFGTMTLCRPL